MQILETKLPCSAFPLLLCLDGPPVRLLHQSTKTIHVPTSKHPKESTKVGDFFDPMGQKGNMYSTNIIVTPSAPTPPLTNALPANDDRLLTVADVAQILNCPETSVYGLTRKRGQMRMRNPLPLLRLPMGLRFKKSSILAWIDQQEQKTGIQ